MSLMEHIKTTIAELMAAARRARAPAVQSQAHKRQTRYTYTEGPMYFLGQQIVKAMQDAGYPAKIIECWRPPGRQHDLHASGRSKAEAWQSPHQYYEAVDIVHESMGWRVDLEFWETLASCVRIVAERYAVELVHGHEWGWDSAHVELKDWRTVRRRQHLAWLDNPDVTTRQPTAADLWRRFEEVLPGVARQHKKTRSGKVQSGADSAGESPR